MALSFKLFVNIHLTQNSKPYPRSTLAAFWRKLLTCHGRSACSACTLQYDGAERVTERAPIVPSDAPSSAIRTRLTTTHASTAIHNHASYLTIGRIESICELPMTHRLVNRLMKKVQDLDIDNVGFFNWHRMGCARDNGFVTAWNGFGQLVRVLALN